LGLLVWRVQTALAAVAGADARREEGAAGPGLAAAREGLVAILAEVARRSRAPRPSKRASRARVFVEER